MVVPETSPLRILFASNSPRLRARPVAVHATLPNRAALRPDSKLASSASGLGSGPPARAGRSTFDVARLRAPPPVRVGIAIATLPACARIQANSLMQRTTCNYYLQKLTTQRYRRPPRAPIALARSTRAARDGSAIAGPVGGRLRGRGRGCGCGGRGAMGARARAREGRRRGAGEEGICFRSPWLRTCADGVSKDVRFERLFLARQSKALLPHSLRTRFVRYVIPDVAKS